MNYPTDVITNFTGDHSFLSNAWKLPPNRRIPYEGIFYPSVDHAFQAAKTFDSHQREFIASVSAPNVARILANHIVRRLDWLDVRLDIMRELMFLKFVICGAELMPKLLATNDQEIVFLDIKKDTFWGAIYDESNRTWRGDNYIGKALMSIRFYWRNPCRVVDWDLETIDNVDKPCI